MAASGRHKRPDFTAAQYRSAYADWSHEKITEQMDICKREISRANRDAYCVQTELVLARVELDNSGYYSPRELHPTKRQLELLSEIRRLEEAGDRLLSSGRDGANSVKWYQLEVIERMEYRPPFTAVEAAEVADMWARVANEDEEDAVIGVSYVEGVAEYAMEQAEIATRESGAVARKAAARAAETAGNAMICAEISKEWNDIADESAAKARKAAAEAKRAAKAERRGYERK